MSGGYSGTYFKCGITVLSEALLAPNIWGHGPVTSVVVRAYNGDLGWSGRRIPLKLKHFWFLDV